MALEIRIGYSSETGPRNENEDFGGFVTPDAETCAIEGCLVVLADGISGGTRGRKAAESTVRNLLGDYYSTLETWETPRALNTILQSINRWLNGHSAGLRA